MPTLIGEKREGDIRLSNKNGSVTVEETYSYIVRADSKFQSRLEIAQTTGLPIVNVTTSSGGLCVCKSKVATKREDNPLIYDVVCEFSSEVDENNDQNNQTGSDPTAWVPVRETIFYQKEEYRQIDAAGAAYKNSAGQYITGIPPRKRTLVAWRFAQFEPISVTDETLADRNETVNVSTYKTKAAKTLLLTVEKSTLGYYYGRRLRYTEYLLKYDPKTWVAKRLDVGTVYKSGSDLLPYTDKAGNVIEGPLNGSGGKQTVGTAPAILSFDDYTTSTFSFLRI